MRHLLSRQPLDTGSLAIQRSPKRTDALVEGGRKTRISDHITMANKADTLTDTQLIRQGLEVVLIAQGGHPMGGAVAERNTITR